MNSDASSTSNVESPGWWMNTAPLEDAYDYLPQQIDSQPLGVAPQSMQVQSQSPTAEQQLNNQSSNRSTIAVACVPCRSRHLKCDGGARCSRCSVEGIQCTYVKSRRGWKGPRKFSRKHSVQNSERTLVDQTNNTPPVADAFLPEVNLLPTFTNSMPSFLDPISQNRTQKQIAIATLSAEVSLVDASPRGLMEAFYVFFYAAHPFLLPKARMLDALARHPQPHLELAMRYIGSCYVPAARDGALRAAVHEALSKRTSPDGTMVQAMMLFAIGLHMNNDEQPAIRVLRSAATIALNIGLHRRDFAIEHGDHDRQIEESWRRTWWELFTIDAMLAGVTPNCLPQLLNVPTDVPLPCEENEFASNQIPISHTLDEYDDSLFTDEGVIYSSYTYRIDAARMLGRAMHSSRVNPMEALPDVSFTETSLANWSLHLPEPKRKPVDRNGNVDEVLFQAHMMANATALMLHRPRSDLNFEDVKNINACASTGQALPADYRELHTAKAMQAADNMSKLINLPSPLIKHSPFLTCGVTMASVVFLSYWSFIATDGSDTVIKEQIRLNIGVLQTMADWWPIAQTVLGQVKGVAKELFSSRRAMNSAYWNKVTQDEIIRGIIEERDTSSSEENVYEFLTL